MHYLRGNPSNLPPRFASTLIPPPKWVPFNVILDQNKNGVLLGGELKTIFCNHVGVSKNNGISKSSMLIGFSIINHIFWGVYHPYFWVDIHRFFLGDQVSQRPSRTFELPVGPSLELGVE